MQFNGRHVEVQRKPSQQLFMQSPNFWKCYYRHERTKLWISLFRIAASMAVMVLVGSQHVFGGVVLRTGLRSWSICLDQAGSTWPPHPGSSDSAAVLMLLPVWQCLLPSFASATEPLNFIFSPGLCLTACCCRATAVSHRPGVEAACLQPGRLHRHGRRRGPLRIRPPRALAPGVRGHSSTPPVLRPGGSRTAQVCGQGAFI